MPDLDCVLYLRFWTPECYRADDTTGDQLFRRGVASIIGEEIHVDCLIHNPSTPTQILVCFTTFEGETFGVNPTKTTGSDGASMIQVAIDDATAVHLTDHLWSMTHRELPYNYSDSHFLMPFWSPYTQTMVNDVHSGDVTSVFCSQAIILAMRECLPEGGAMTAHLHQLNSRLTSPAYLYRVMCKYPETIMDAVDYTDFHGRIAAATTESTKFVICR
jgi:hypothetical protein